MGDIKIMQSDKEIRISVFPMKYPSGKDMRRLRRAANRNS